MVTRSDILRIIRQRRWLVTALAVVLAFMAVIIFARVWVTLDSGRSFIEGQLDGREAGRFGTIHVEGITGDPLNRFQIEHLTLTDSVGVWLSIENADLAWSPGSLMSRTADLDFVRAETIEVMRRPVLSPATESSSSGGWSVSLDELNIAELALAEGVAGPKSAFAIDGQFSLPKERTFALSLNAEPLEGAGDRIAAKLQRMADGAYDLDASVTAPAGGTLSTLAGLAEGDDASLTAKASGTLDEGDGFAELKISGSRAAEVTGKITGGNLLANAEVDTEHLPISDRLKSLLGHAAALTLEADINEREVPFKTSGSFATGSFSADGIYLSRKHELDGPLAVDLTFSGLNELAGLNADLTYSGTITPPSDGLSAEGVATLTAMEGNDLPFDSITGPVSFISEDDEIRFESSLGGTGILKGIEAAQGVFGANPRIDLSGHYDRSDGALTISPSIIRMENGEMGIQGIIGTKSRDLTLQLRLQRVSGFLASASNLSASGSLSVTGTVSAPRLNADIRLNGVERFNQTAAAFLGDRVRLNASALKTGQTYQIQKLSLEGGALTLNGSGTYGPDGALRLSGQFGQSAPVEVSGNNLNLNAGTFALSGASGVQDIQITAQGGMFSRDTLSISDLNASLAFSKTVSRWAGPVTLTGNIDNRPLELSTLASWNEGTFQIEDLEGSYDTAWISGALSYGLDGELEMTGTATGDRFIYGERHIGEFGVTLKIERDPDSGLSVAASGDVEDVWLSPVLRFDHIDGEIRNAPEGYNFVVQVLRDHDLRPTQMSMSGSADLAGDYPSGRLEIDGRLLGKRISSTRPISWRLGETPAIDARVAMFDGVLEANINNQEKSPHLVIDIEDIDLSPMLASYGFATGNVMLNGEGDLYLFGSKPRGDFAIAAKGPVPGLEGALAIDLTGRLTNNILAVNGIGNYGELRLEADAAIPFEARPNDIARPALSKPVKGKATLKGDLAALRPVALAYGHDIGGAFDGLATLSGTLEAPVFQAEADLQNGIYEFGTTGLRLVDVSLSSAYRETAIILDGSGKGADGGTVKFSGTLGRTGSDLGAQFSNLMLFDRDGDTLRASGDVSLSGDKTGRAIEGDIDIESARLSLDNLPSSKARAIDVRWKEDSTEAMMESELRRTLTLDIDVEADRRIFISGRGLESEWGVDLSLTGTPADPLLNGEAKLRRGTLDLAGRPFVFETGTITFNGPLNRARLDIKADRSVNGFDATVALLGSPTSPTIELSSSPELPQDEILSRLLFGRSSVDLSALEAAQLANSIARLSGKGTGFDPTSELQTALGVDRLSLGTTDAGAAQVGVGQYLADDVYLELNSAGAAGSSVEVEWEPRPQISVTSETRTDGEARVSIKWKKDY